MARCSSMPLPLAMSRSRNRRSQHDNSDEPPTRAGHGRELWTTFLPRFALDKVGRLRRQEIEQLQFSLGRTARAAIVRREHAQHSRRTAYSGVACTVRASAASMASSARVPMKIELRRRATSSTMTRALFSRALRHGGPGDNRK
jgi:hypothetical protein